MLVKASSADYATAWQDATMPWTLVPSQSYAGPAAATGPFALSSYYDNRALGLVLPIARPTVVDRLAVAVSSAGSPGTLLRLGVYRIELNGASTRVIDAGAVNAASVGRLQLSFAPVTLAPGLVVLAARLEGVTTTRPTVLCATAWNVSIPWTPTVTSTTMHGGGVVVSVDQWPATGIVAASGSGPVPLVQLRVAP